MPLTPAQRSTRSSIAGITSWAMTVDRSARSKPGAEALLAKFVEQVPPEITDPDDRRRAGEELRRAHMKRLALASSKARAARNSKALGSPSIVASPKDAA